MKISLGRIGGVGIVFASIMSYAQAADMAVKAPPAAPPAPATWTGCYVGLEGGGAWSTLTATGQAPSPALPAATIHANGALLGGTIGCQTQSQQWVFGVEDDSSWLNVNGSGNAVPPFAPAVGSGSQHWLDTLRGRIGLANGNWLFFATGGGAFTNIKSTDTIAAGPATVAFDATGWTVGGGVELKLAPQWSVKAEYLYIDFGTNNTNFKAIAPAHANTNSGLTENLVRIGLNYRFWQ